MKYLLLLAMSLTIALASQNAMAISWAKINKPLVVSSDKSISVEIPVGWVRAYDDRNQILATYDGLPIQAIEVLRDKHSDKVFEKIEKSSNGNMLASELAELVIAEMKAQSEMVHVNVIDNGPAMIGKNQGFKVQVTYRNQKGLEYGQIIYGFADEKNLYRLFYRAPIIRYFERDKQTFEQVVSSFKKGEKALY